MKRVQIKEYLTSEDYINCKHQIRLNVGLIGRLKYIIFGYKIVFEIEVTKLI